ncbi:MAG: hypothetical protein JRC87_10090 [Deltaproteobacteria bacterium]|nr:hypothetical protein [Deltaproteobacteria bacterium]
MNKVIIGMIICLSALMLIHMNHAIAGIPAFIAGIVIMNRGGGGQE